MPAFAIWLTGLPASGKSAIAKALLAALQARGIEPAVLESDVLRTQITPRPRYDEAGRALFYEIMADLGALLVERGIAVILDATANRRAWRDRARSRISRFAEVFVDCPLAVCRARDPKGLYREAARGAATNLPGLQAPYEPPERPELVVRTESESADDAARRIVGFLERRLWL